jgi:NAD(P)-dependent dehydrogenase (short-subunit alcohol dehydrogenase family)
MIINQGSIKLLFDIAGKSALVTGASGALGKIAALALAASGARLTLAAGNAAELEEIARQAGDLGGDVNVINRRPETEADAEAMVAAAVTAYGKLDLIVVASGVNKVGKIHEYKAQDWHTVMDANVLGSWLVCKAASKQMIAQGTGGKVVLVSSTRGKLGHPAGYTTYCASKSAVDGLVRSLACEWGEHKINVNAIAPTVFRSQLTEWMYSDTDPGKSTRLSILQRIPLGRLGEPEDLAGVLMFLLSPASDFCTGQILYVDGGYTAG